MFFSIQRDDSVAQLVEQYTFNVWVLGPSPSGITKPHRDVGLFYGILNIEQGILNVEVILAIYYLIGFPTSAINHIVLKNINFITVNLPL